MYGGALCFLPVGEGKTLISYLLPLVMQATKPLLLVPASMLMKTRRDFNALRKHWRQGAKTTLMSYEYVSRDRKALTNIGPDLIIADESYCLKNPKAGVTQRCYQYFRDFDCNFVSLTATPADRSFSEYWHLQQWALPPERQPLPETHNECEVWGQALDEKLTTRRPLGALSAFGSDLKSAREGYGDLLYQCPGVILMRGSSVRASLHIELVRKLLSEPLQKELRKMRHTWETPAGIEFCEAVDLWRHTRELANGFYYQWEEQPPEEWLTRRKAYMRLIRHLIAHRSELHTESDVLTYLPNSPHIRAWQEVKGIFTPRTEAVWLSDEVLEYAHDWLKKHKGIVWVEHRAVGERLERLSGKPYYRDQGCDSNGNSIMDSKGGCIASIASCGKGFNLQQYSECLVLNAPPKGSVWEQMIGRLHRAGQEADLVRIEVLYSTSEQLQGFWQAHKDSEYSQATSKLKRKLCIADITNRSSKK
jgi:hypothetical protein